MKQQNILNVIKARLNMEDIIKKEIKKDWKFEIKI